MTTLGLDTTFFMTPDETSGCVVDSKRFISDTVETYLDVQLLRRGSVAAMHASERVSLRSARITERPLPHY